MSNECMICGGKGWIIIERRYDDTRSNRYDEVMPCQKCLEEFEVPLGGFAPSGIIPIDTSWHPCKINQDIGMCRNISQGIEERPLKWWEKIIYFRYINKNQFQSAKAI